MYLTGVGVGGYSHTLPIQVCATQRGRDFEAPDLERFSESFSRTGYNILNAQKLQFCTQPFKIIQEHITFKNMVQFTNFLEQSLKNWPISRMGYQF